jgi:chromosome segregation ATPase
MTQTELDALQAEAFDLEQEIARLTALADELTAALGEFDHQARRYRDALERAGGRSREVEQALEQLRGNQDLAGRDRTAAQAALDALRDRLAAIQARIAALPGPGSGA